LEVDEFEQIGFEAVPHEEAWFVPIDDVPIGPSCPLSPMVWVDDDRLLGELKIPAGLVGRDGLLATPIRRRPFDSDLGLLGIRPSQPRRVRRTRLTGCTDRTAPVTSDRSLRALASDPGI
jgi:hypothetical protein